MMNAIFTQAGTEPATTPTAVPAKPEPVPARKEPPARQNPPTPIKEPGADPAPRRETFPSRCPCGEAAGDFSSACLPDFRALQLGA